MPPPLLDRLELEVGLQGLDPRPLQLLVNVAERVLIVVPQAPWWRHNGVKSPW